MTAENQTFDDTHYQKLSEAISKYTAIFAGLMLDSYKSDDCNCVTVKLINNESGRVVATQDHTCNTCSHGNLFEQPVSTEPTLDLLDDLESDVLAFLQSFRADNEKSITFNAIDTWHDWITDLKENVTEIIKEKRIA